MPEYMAVRKHHTLLEICRTPEIAAEVTITAAERLGVDAAIIFADLLLPLEPMGLDFEFQAGEGPVVHKPVRTAEDVRQLDSRQALADKQIQVVQGTGLYLDEDLIFARLRIGNVLIFQYRWIPEFMNPNRFHRFAPQQAGVGRFFAATPLNPYMD